MLACAAVLAAPAFAGNVLPKAMSTYLLGPKLIRAEIGVVKGKGATLDDWRLDRGKLVKRYAAGSIILLERDSTKATIKNAMPPQIISGTAGVMMLAALLQSSSAFSKPL